MEKIPLFTFLCNGNGESYFTDAVTDALFGSMGRFIDERKLPGRKQVVGEPL